MPRLPRICATCGLEYEQDTLFCPKDGTPLGSSRNQPGEDPYIGLTISDQIEIRQLIGIGSMGRVYRAWQKGVERDVAVKLLHRELSANTTLVARFLREARIASRLQHPNVVQVLMAGQLPPGSSAAPIGGELYIVMEFLDGISLLSALAASNGAVPLPRALHLALQICDAVGEAHAQGIVHRDLKPENVVLVRRGDDPDFVKVLDFGIARLDWGQGSVATQAGLIFGTARYISPEGSRGEQVGPAADVYSIATILYQALAGRTPFENDSPMALLMMHTYETPPPITSIQRASYLPAPLAAAIMRNLDKSPEVRAPEARALGRALVDAARASGMSPDDLVPRSTLLGQRMASASTFRSIEPTNKLHLSARVAQIIGAHGTTGDGSAAAAPARAAESRSEPEESSHDAGTPASTVVAEPSPGARVSAVPMRPLQPQTPDPAVAAQGSRTSTVPLRAGATPMPAALPTATGTVRTLDDGDEEEVPATARRHRARSIVVVVACFLAGAGLVAAGAHRLGYLGGPGVQSVESYAKRADSALRARRWSSPPGDNVKDITNEGLVRFPGDPALLDLRRRAAQELVTLALGRKYAGDLPGAHGDAVLARELAPDNTTAQHLVDELRALMDARGGAVVVDPANSSLPGEGPGHGLRRGETKTSPRTTAGAGSPATAPPSGGPPPNPDDSSRESSPPSPSATASTGRWL